jgi:hypothetical protein
MNEDLLLQTRCKRRAIGTARIADPKTKTGSLHAPNVTLDHLHALNIQFS